MHYPVPVVVPAQVQAALRSAAREKKPHIVVDILRRYEGLSLADVFSLLGADALAQITVRDLIAGPRPPAPRPARKPAPRRARPARPERPALPERPDRPPPPDERFDWASEDLLEAVLAALGRARKPMTTAELGAIVGVHTASILRAVRRLRDRIHLTYEGHHHRYTLLRGEPEPKPKPRPQSRRVFLITG